MRILIFGILSLSLSIGLFGQNICVKDKANGMRLDGVMLTDDDGHKAFTDEEGEVDISDFKSADRVYIVQMGYNELVTSYKELVALKGLVFMTPNKISLDEATVHGSRWEQYRVVVSNKVVALDKKDVILQNPQTTADLLGFSNQVYVQKSQLGGGSPMIRGFSTNRLLIAVDGIRMNNAIFRAGNVQNVISIDPNTVETSEIIFGPGSVIYGSDAIGGVMSFYTLEPKFSTSDNILVKGAWQGRYSTANNERSTHLDINLGWKKWASVTSFSFSDFDDLRMGSYGPDDYLVPHYVSRIDTQDVVVENSDDQVQVPTGYSQYGLMQKIRFKPNKKWDLIYGLHYSTTSDYSRFDRHRRMRNGLPRYGEWYYGPQEWMMNHLGVKYQSNHKLFDNISLQLAYQNFEESRHSRDFNDVNLESNTEHVDAYSVNLDFEKSSDDKHSLFYGGELVFNKVGSTGVSKNINTNESTAIATRYPDGSTWAAYGLYMSYEFVPSKLLSFQVGARYSGFSLDAEFDTSFYKFPFTDVSNSASALSGSAGVVYKPSSSMKIRANVSTGFRAPNIDDIGKIFDPEDGTVIVPNPELEAEYAYNFELGMAKVFGKTLKLDVSAFYTILKDAQVRRPFTLNGQDSVMYNGEMSQVLAIQNAAKAYVYGLQFGAELKLPGGFGASTYYNIQKGEEELDDGSTASLRHAAPAFGSTHLIYNRGKLEFDLSVVYNAEIAYNDLAPSEQEKGEIYAADVNGNPYSPSWYTLNIKSSYWLSKQIILTAGIENITDQRYLPYSSGLVAPGINFIFGLRAQI